MQPASVPERGTWNEWRRHQGSARCARGGGEGSQPNLRTRTGVRFAKNRVGAACAAARAVDRTAVLSGEIAFSQRERRRESVAVALRGCGFV